jgi:hypothetical protein
MNAVLVGSLGDFFKVTLEPSSFFQTILPSKGVVALLGTEFPAIAVNASANVKNDVMRVFFIVCFWVGLFNFLHL